MSPPELPDSPGEQANMRRKLEQLHIDCSKELAKGLEEFNSRFDKAPADQWRALDDEAGSTFSEVFRFELDALGGNVPKHAGPADLTDVYAAAHEAGLAGLAFSGGGIRSATFNLGVVQALAQSRVLHDFDYLSTVSGGSYIGGWLSKWIHHLQGDVTRLESEMAGAVPRSPDPDAAAPSPGSDTVPPSPDANEEQTSPGPVKPATRAEPRPVQYLRRYSNYLTPRTGMFSADTWTLVCTYVRNTLLNLLILMAWLSAVFLLPRLLLPGIAAAMAGTESIWPFAVAVFLLAVAGIAFSISRRDPRPWQGWGLQGQGGVLVGVCIPLLLAGLLGSMALRQEQASLATFWDDLPDSLSPEYSFMLLPGLCYFLAWGLGWSSAQLLNWRDAKRAAADKAGKAGKKAEAGTPGAAGNAGNAGETNENDKVAKSEQSANCHNAGKSEKSDTSDTSVNSGAAGTTGTSDKSDNSAAYPFSLRKVFREGSVHLISAAIALAAGSILLLKLVSLVQASAYRDVNAVRLATFGMPIMLCLFGVTITLMIGLVGREYRDESREWWARQGAWTVIFALGWLGLFACTFYLPPLLDWAWDTYLATTLIAGAVTTALTLAGLKAGSGKATGEGSTSSWKEWVALVAPYAFSILVIALLTTWLQRVVAPVTTPAANAPAVQVHASRGELVMRCAALPDGSSPPSRELACKMTLATPDAAAGDGKPSLPAYLNLYTRRSSEAKCTMDELARRPPGATPACAADGMSPFVLFAGCLVVAFVVSWRVDINKFSLYMMYRLRLVRAYLGASTPKRAAHPFTGFDPEDDLPMPRLLRQWSGDTAVDVVQRPYHLINAAVNLVGGKELGWQNRKAGNFVFSPAFCGFELPAMPGTDDARPQLRGAFRPSVKYAADEAALRDNDAGVKLGTAVAVSGAAASPNMGYHSSLPLAFLMTLFNLRLGRWSPNPIRKDLWRRPAPYIGLFSIISELLGQTDSDARFLYLSDGGHFENLGVYELVRRRCKLIIAVDASADTRYAFDDLGNAVRKCLTDFNVPIDLKPGKIRRLGEGETGACFVAGTVRYSQADGECEDGVLLYIKPAIAGGENADLLNYSRVNPEFPHQSTADQWFDESQFESYRLLGYQAGMSALADVVAALKKDSLTERRQRLARMRDVLRPRTDTKS
ncbi:patatin-like phospholipase family protein [Pseudoduganella sp. SL102]|uniref:patatin-like phospholipase family protein n=1 Tax=Pseudoduganella sp. SL102 TaxID=2995154 RepID=UPI00248B9AEF|nr:patatin-like phospholipase family protein [Pseudoduganella sp. SL102]WBS00033.1 patatin-like phospholipase family protein [Pseudoduganella sp. SL102]